MKIGARGLVVTGAALLAGCAGLLAVSGEIPRWRSGGSAMVMHEPLAPLGDCELPQSDQLRILFLGDSNMAGSRVGGNEHAFPHLAVRNSGARLVIDNRAVGGAVLHDAPTQGSGAGPADLVVVMFGGNDAAPRGFLSRKLRWSPHQFRHDLAELVRQYRQQGAQVLVLAPLPAGSRAMDRRIAPYRQAAREGAAVGGGCFRDPVEAFATAGPGRPYLQYDGLHLTPLGQQALAGWMKPLISPANKT